jgi:hypothetical protein
MKQRKGKKDSMKELTERKTNNTMQSRHKFWLSNILSEEEGYRKGEWY